MPFYVYILRCSDGSYYTGYARDVARRVAEHNKGKAAKYTCGRRPVELVYQESQATRGLAMQREYEIKRLRRAGKQALIDKGVDG